MTKSYITIRYNSESFYGDSTESEIAKVDHEASTADYERRIIARLREHYNPSELGITFEYTTTGNFLTIKADDAKTEQEIYDLVYHVTEQVYNQGAFWFEK